MLVGWGVGSGNTIPLEGGWRRFPVPLARLKGGRWGRHLLARCSLEESLLHGNCQASRGTFSKIKYFNKCLPKKKSPKREERMKRTGQNQARLQMSAWRREPEAFHQLFLFFFLWTAEFSSGLGLGWLVEFFFSFFALSLPHPSFSLEWLPASQLFFLYREQEKECYLSKKNTIFITIIITACYSQLAKWNWHRSYN